MRAIDTHVLVRLWVRDEAAQVAAAEAYVAGGAWVSQLVLAEACWVVAAVYGWRRSDIAQAVAMVLQHRDLALQDASAVARALELFQASGGVEFPDCLVLEVARAHGHAPLGTFDQKLGALPGAIRLGARRA